MVFLVVVRALILPLEEERARCLLLFFATAEGYLRKRRDEYTLISRCLALVFMCFLCEWLLVFGVLCPYSSFLGYLFSYLFVMYGGVSSGGVSTDSPAGGGTGARFALIFRYC